MSLLQAPLPALRTPKTSSNSLVRHLSGIVLIVEAERIQTPDTNEKPYKYDCGASFSRRDLLKGHQGAGRVPIAPSTPKPSPAAVHDIRNNQSPADLSYIGASKSLTGPTDTQNTLTGPIGQDRPLSDEQPGVLYCNFIVNYQAQTPSN